MSNCIICYEKCTQTNSQLLDCNYYSDNKIHNSCIDKLIHTKLTNSNQEIMQCPLCRYDITVKYNIMVKYNIIFIFICLVLLYVIYFLKPSNIYIQILLFGFCIIISAIIINNKHINYEKNIYFFSHYTYKPPTYLR